MSMPAPVRSFPVHAHPAAFVAASIAAVDADLPLLERWRAGDQQAGRDLVGRHFREVYRFFEHKARGDADDLVQRTFLACLAARHQFRAESSFRTYLFTIARNELYSHFRDLREEPVDFDQISIEAIVTSPASRLGKEQRVEQLRAVLRELPAEQQLLLELRYWHDLDGAALAEVFDTTAAAIRVRLLRARRALRERLAAWDPGAISDPLVRSLTGGDADDDGSAR
jgi:RNA polymerase sigma factor (sigma-70 family)